MKKTFLFLLVLVSSCFSQYVPQFLTQPPVGYQINLGHPDAQGLLGRWLIHEGSGLKVYDLSPYGNDGILTGMDEADWVAGRDGWALDFDGSNDYINLQKALVTVPPFSITAWIFARTFATNGHAIFSISDNSDVRHQHALIISDNGGGSAGDDLSAMSRDDDGGGLFKSATSTKVLTTNTWHFVVGVWASTADRKAYVDGGNLGTNTETSAPAGINISEIARLSDSSPNWEFDGLIADIKFYNRALTADEVESFYVNSYAMFDQPPGRILTAAAAVRRRNINIF